MKMNVTAEYDEKQNCYRLYETSNPERTIGYSDLGEIMDYCNDMGLILTCINNGKEGI